MQHPYVYFDNECPYPFRQTTDQGWGKKKGAKGKKSVLCSSTTRSHIPSHETFHATPCNTTHGNDTDSGPRNKPAQNKNLFPNNNDKPWVCIDGSYRNEWR
jgi:hypothetical protein